MNNYEKYYKMENTQILNWQIRVPRETVELLRKRMEQLASFLAQLLEEDDTLNASTLSIHLRYRRQCCGAVSGPIRIQRLI